MHLWRILSALLYDQRLPLTYEGEPAGRRDGPPKPLDAIDPKLVGSLATKQLFGHAGRERLKCLEDALSLLTSEAAARHPWVSLIQPMDRKRRINERYEDHIRSLVTCGLMRRANDSIGFSSYFCVDKDEEHSRAIFNGKRLSRACPVPDPVNLIDTRKLVEEIRRFYRQTHAKSKEGAGARRVFGYLGDFRHWFHQINAPEVLRRLFGMINAGGEEYQWQSIPMGWSWSPVIAQSVAWSVITYARPEQEQLFDLTGLQGDQLPTYIKLKDHRGIALVYYDNFILLTDHAATRDEFRRRMEGAEKSLGVHIKDGSTRVINPKDFIAKGFEFLGVHFQGIRDGRKDLSGIKWRPRRTGEWAVNDRTAPKIRQGSPVTCREVATLSGQATFSLMLSPEGLRRHHHYRAVASAARRAGQVSWHAGGKDRWESTFDPSFDLGPLLKAWGYAVEKEAKPYEELFDGRSQEFADPTYTWLLCSDASKSGVGWCALRHTDAGYREALPHQCLGRRLSEEESQAHITHLELDAFIEGLLWWKRYGPPDKRVTAVVDNAALAFILRNGVSGNQRINDALSRPEVAAGLDLVEDVILVISEDNPSDCCSRPNDPDAHRTFLQRCQQVDKAVRARREGWNWASQKRKAFDQAQRAGPMRHSECALTDEDSDEEWALEAVGV